MFTKPSTLSDMCFVEVNRTLNAGRSKVRQGPRHSFGERRPSCAKAVVCSLPASLLPLHAWAAELTRLSHLICPSCFRVICSGFPAWGGSSIAGPSAVVTMCLPCREGSESLLLLRQVKKLQSILKPMMLRRLKDDVEKNLAPKQETIIEVELTNIQKKYYRAILEKNFSFLSKGANQHNMPNLINTMMELRKCCNHPYLINGEGCAQEVWGGQILLQHFLVTTFRAHLAWQPARALMPTAAGVIVHPGPTQDAVICLIAPTGSPTPHRYWWTHYGLRSLLCLGVFWCGTSPTSQPGLFCQALKKE